jgi:DNA ligase (NAD+)
MDASTIEARLLELPATALEVLVRRANREYWDEDDPSLPDTLYDRMVERLRALAPRARVLVELGPSAPEGPALDVEDVERQPPEARFGATVEHDPPMLSLDKCYRASDLLAWAARFEGELVVMPKLDGIALSIRYGSDGRVRVAATRGSGTAGEDVTANVLEIDDIPRRLSSPPRALDVRGELFMPKSVFERYRGEFANPRNLAAGAIKHKDRARSRAYGLRFFAYDVLGTDAEDEREKMALLDGLGVPVVDHAFLERDELEAAFERYARMRVELDYELDGVVYRAARVSEQRRLGSTAHHPRAAIAYKFQGDTGQTRLTDVRWSVSRTGTITPTAVLEPIELSGARITKAGLHNLTRFGELGMTRGAVLEVTRRGGVIPHVERVVEHRPGTETFEIPTSCPACGRPVLTRKKREGEFLQCSSPDECASSRLRELEHFATVVDIQGFGPKILGQVADAGLLTTPADLFRLEVRDLEALPRLGRKSAENLVGQVEAHREIPLATFLEALGIEHLGRRNASLLAAEFHSLDRLRALTRDELMQVKGIKEAIADSVVRGLARRAPVIEDLIAAGVRVLDGAAARDATRTNEGPLAGKSFVFTGALETVDRKTAQSMVRALGGATPEGVTKTLSYLVVGAGPGKTSTKRKKAEKLRKEGSTLEIITEATFFAMVGDQDANRAF